MRLSEFYNSLNPKSDKGTEHDYINGYYDAEFTPKKDDHIRIMEIGVLNGESINLWQQYFNKADILGVDIVISDKAHQLVKTDNRCGFLADGSAYLQTFVDEYFDVAYWDYIIDDGPHTLQSQLSFIQLYYPKIKKGGKLIIEDIQSKSDLEAIEQKLKELKYKYKIFDLTSNKGRYDDILIEITK